MSTHLTTNLVVALQTINENAGKLCFDNILTRSGVSATSETSTSPATNLANTSTAFGWEAEDTADQTITITNTDRQEIDFLGIARHNLNQSGLRVRIRFDGSTVQDYTAISATQSQLVLFEGALPSVIQIDITGGTEAAKIAVIYVGKSVDLERNIYGGHTPIVYGRERSTITGVSQSGEYLGEVVLNQSLANTVSLNNLTPTWYRNTLDAFFSRSPRAPCFYAWRPGDYPTEVAYCWIEGNPKPTNTGTRGLMSISWNFRGIA